MLNSIIETESLYGAPNYRPLPLVLSKGQGVYVWDVAGKRYLDMMSAYSAVSFGHCHPKLVATLMKQAQTLNVVSRAFYTDRLSPFLEYACQLLNQDKALMMNTGAEAVETAIKAMRRWAYFKKGVPENEAEIIVCEGNFHGRTTTIISFSSEPSYQEGFGPLTPGFKIIPYGNADALEAAITRHTAGFLVEPIQGEAGIRVPPDGYLKQCAEICQRNQVLLVSDEVQTGLGRTGKLLACQHEGVKPDGITLGKALGGGLLPVSAFMASDELMGVFTPGSHGSTFGGNPLAATVALEALQVLMEENLVQHSAESGDYLLTQLRQISSPLIKEVRGKGLFIGMVIDDTRISGRDICLRLLENGLLTKDTHGNVLRFCPPLTITRDQIDEGVRIIQHSFKSLETAL